MLRGSLSHLEFRSHKSNQLEIVCEPHEPGQTIYWLSAKLASADSFLAKSLICSVDYDIMHCCFSHPSKDVLRHASGTTLGFPSITFPHKECICPRCAEGKMIRLVFPASDRRSAKPFDKIHMDLKAMPVCSYHSYSYFLIIFDDATSHGWTVNLKQKSDADSAIWQFIAMVKTQFGLLIKEVQIDAGGEFKSQEFTVFLQELGINILTSVPHMHQQNGHAERFICTVMDKGQAVHLDACLPQNWCKFAVDCATHVYNCTPIQHHDWKMPFENLKRIKPDVTHLCVFRCGAYVFLPEEVRVNKLNPKSELMTFLGYPQGTKGYLFMRGPNNVLFTAVQALFNEALFPKCLDMHRPGYTPVVPVNAQGEYNIPPEDNENGDDGGAPFGPAPPGRHVPYQAPPPLPPKNQGKGKNPNPQVPLEPTLEGLTPSESLSDKFYAPKTPSQRSPSRDDPDSLHGFFDPNSSRFDPLLTSKKLDFQDFHKAVLIKNKNHLSLSDKEKIILLKMV